MRIEDYQIKYSEKRDQDSYSQKVSTDINSSEKYFESVSALLHSPIHELTDFPMASEPK